MSYNIYLEQRRSGLQPLNRKCGPVFHPNKKANLLKPATPDTPQTDPLKTYIVTPQNARDITTAIREQNLETSPFSQRTQTLLSKASKTISKLTTDLAKQRAITDQQARDLKKHKPDKRQATETNQNNVFSRLQEIQSAQNKKNKRLQPLTKSIQTKIDTFVEHSSTKSNKRQQV